MKNSRLHTLLITFMLLLLAACGTSDAVIETPTPTLEVPPTKSIPTESHTPTAETPAETEVIALEGLLPAPIIYLGVEDQPEPVAPGKQNLWRLEVDGVTAMQITDEAMPVTGFSVSPVDGSIVYTTFSENDLYRIYPDGSGRMLLVDGPSLEGPPSGGPAVQLSNPVWSPDGEHIAYGGDGIHFILSSGGESRLILANEPQNVEPKEWVNFYYPISWSPEGTQILVGDAIGGGLLILNVADGAVTIVHNPSGEFYCCSPTWSLNGRSIYFGGMIFDPSIYQAPGLWRIDTNSGNAEVLLPGYENPSVAQDSGMPLNLIQSVQQLDDGNLYALAASGSYEEMWLDEAGNVIGPRLVMTRMNPDGSEPIALRSDADQYGDALWASDASGAVTNIFGSDELPNGTLLWLPSDGAQAIVLGGRGYSYQWSK